MVFGFFTAKKDLTAGTALTTHLGLCKIGGQKIECIRKVYSKEEFESVSSVIAEHRSIIEKYGPKIHQIDEKKRTIYIEYFDCVPLDDYITESINPWEKEGFSELKTIIEKLHKSVSDLNKKGYCHNDTNLGNFLLCKEDMSIRIIDFDTLTKEKKCRDISDISSHIIDALSDNVIIRQQKMTSVFQAQESSIVSLLKSMDKKKLFKFK